jgi:diacylglycerol kinase family enzyme
MYADIERIVGGNLKVAFSKKPGDATAIARRHIKRGFRIVAAVGGDGTINEVANGFFEPADKPAGLDRGAPVRHGAGAMPLRAVSPSAVMAIIPSGTRNVLAKSLGMPEEVSRIKFSKVPRKIDVISATVTGADYSTPQRRVFLNAAEIGLGAEIIDRSKKVRKAVNSRILSTAASIIATVPAYQSNACEIELGAGRGRKKIATNMTMAAVSNGKFLGGGFKAAPEAEMSDGLLDVVVLKDSGSLKVLDKLVNLKLGDYDEQDKIFYGQAKRVTIRSKERNVTVTVDGEPVGMLPATFEVLPRALAVTL